ncbi:hypothetical protein DNU06_05735 [Putridiphycobacter roseus]|uniref:DUF423 domain-containing protein n=1 Tax=Putridiphycobacter roseus TaxID=2219161 RepID=A0A2W1NJI1_9FLAO|nr:hypothetical protein [Putridiphycobacter roseus]PZE18116.1 hypothetical protein DNU06_05735 [Putridiphycobacter roseus]
MNGKYNIAIGFITMGFFMLYGFLLIYLRDFAPNAVAWAESYGNGQHFESRLAHVHGNLFAFLNIVIGYLLLQFSAQLKSVKLISTLALAGLLMPLGILGELYLGLSPIFVILGALSITTAVFILGFSFFKLKK